jgi:hypothetical protein
VAQFFNSYGEVSSRRAGAGILPSSQWTTIIGAVAGTVVTLANLAALGWFGLWMGMTSKNARFAMLKTIVFVQIVPWFVIAVAAVCISGLIVVSSRAGASSGFPLWFPVLNLAVTAGLSLGKDFAFIGLARRNLLKDFRALAGRTRGPSQLSIPPHHLARKP